jgi:cytochrome P450
MSLEPSIFKGTNKVIHNLTAFIPFSFGPANCVGKNLAYQEMRMVVCMLMQKFDMRFEDGFDVKSWEVNMQDYFLTTKGQLPVILTTRNA